MTECPCEYCAVKAFKIMTNMLGVVFDWLYIECKYDESKTYTWKELMDVYMILRLMSSGDSLEEAQKILERDYKDGF